jgi:hypothetical protein
MGDLRRAVFDSAHVDLPMSGDTCVIISRLAFPPGFRSWGPGSGPAPVWATLWLALSKTR